MKTILIAYGTTEGYTRKIAEFIADEIRRYGHEADVIDTAGAPAQQVPPIYAGAILGGSLHAGRYQSSLAHFIKANLEWLAAIPTAFFSVGLAVVGDDRAMRAEAEQQAERFLADTGLRPGMVRHIAGALLFTQYDFFKRVIMRSIARRSGHDTDTSHDTEYTDWDDVRRFAAEYCTHARIDVRKLS
jgi:menaquinone-dependent protoporphyrinogen oxidase